MPGRKWYAVAAAVFVLGGILCALFLWSRLSELGDELPQMVVPGTIELELGRPGDYTLFHEHQSVVEGRFYSSRDISGLELHLVSSSTGEPVELRAPSGNTTYSLGGRSGVSVAAFDIDEPGSYRFSAAYPDGSPEPRTVLAIGQGFGRKLAMTILGGVAIGLSSSLLAVAIGAVTFWKRRGAARRAEGGRSAEQPQIT
jgi:hypothetical protein